MMETKEKVLNLLAAKREIKALLDEHKPILDALKSNRSYDIQEVLKFANSITMTVHAPKNWSENLVLVGQPPAPLPEQMRGGALEHYNYQLNKLRKRGIAPIVAHTRSISPRHLQDEAEDEGDDEDDDDDDDEDREVGEGTAGMEVKDSVDSAKKQKLDDEVKPTSSEKPKPATVAIPLLKKGPEAAKVSITSPQPSTDIFGISDSDSEEEDED